MGSILWLADITSKDGAKVGGKALNLAEVARAGLPVPAGFCITTTAYERFLTANRLEAAIQSFLSLPADKVREDTPHIQQAIRAGQIGAQTRDEILRAYRQLAGSDLNACVPVAVRSSATAEDLPTASFAGQHSTMLNIRDEQHLLSAILECWASLWSPRAIAYRRRQGPDQHWPLVAVVVQLMVDAEAAGVAFSIDPIHGEEKVLIEASWGLGETVVRGDGGLDRYSVDRNMCAEVEPPSIGEKVHKRVLSTKGGVLKMEVPAEMQDARALTREQVTQVAEATLALEQHFACPQDVEWAFAGGQLSILQSRPITATGYSFFTDVLPGDNTIWTSGFLNERFPLPVSPLGWSVIQELLEELAFRAPLRYLGLGGADRLRITRLYHGHPYVNMFVFQTLYKVFPDSLLPEDAYRYFPDGKIELRRSVDYPRSALDPRFLLSMIWHFVREPKVWSPWHNDRVWAALTARHERVSQKLAAKAHGLSQGDTGVERLWAAIHEAQQWNANLLALHRWSLTHADLTYSLLRRLVRAWSKHQDPAGLCARLVTGLPNKSLEMDDALRDLAQIEDRTALSTALEAFLIRYGHRSFHLDIYHPSFADHPEQVLDVLKQLRSESQRPAEERTTDRRMAVQSMHQSLGGGPLGWLKRALVDHVMRLSRRYLPLREEQRFYWQRMLAIMRKLFLLMGKRMEAAEVLSHAEDVFFLTKEEIEAYVQDETSGEEYAVLAETRQRQFARLCQEFEAAPERTYPPFLRGNRPLELAAVDGTRQFSGRAVSPGLGRGRAVVLYSPADLYKVQAGDVLVTRSVDPGWTPVFGLLQALVMECGGQLSHGAVVAREYGLPAVVGIAGITELLHDGDTVIVDAHNGVVIKVAGE
jgi:pyruvate,water dikinase